MIPHLGDFLAWLQSLTLLADAFFTSFVSCVFEQVSGRHDEKEFQRVPYPKRTRRQEPAQSSGQVPECPQKHRGIHTVGFPQVFWMRL